jgi:hypothetical protein
MGHMSLTSTAAPRRHPLRTVAYSLPPSHTCQRMGHMSLTSTAAPRRHPLRTVAYSLPPSHTCQRIGHMSLTSTAAPRRHPLRTVNYSLLPILNMPADGACHTYFHRCTASTFFKDRRLSLTSPPTYASRRGMSHLLPPLHRVYIL